MLTFTALAAFIALRLLTVIVGPTVSVHAVPASSPPATASQYWVEDIKRQGTVPFGDSSYKVFRNVKDYGAKGM